MDTHLKNFFVNLIIKIVKSVLFEPDIKNLQILNIKCEKEFINLNGDFI